MPPDQPSGLDLLKHAYEVLGLYGDDLVKAAATPPADIDPAIWREIGDWLLLGDRVGADRIFFVRDDPVLIFSSLPSDADQKDVLALYKRAWSMARPRCLFLAIGPELRVYGLNTPPPADDEAGSELTPLQIVERAADVGNALQRFHRDSLESGVAFERDDLVSSSGRADQRLLLDVQIATDALVQSGLVPRDAHALIERAILIRYLEDREVLTADYFSELFAAHEPSNAPDGVLSNFIRCLTKRTLTFELFAKLAADFNGDLFVLEPHERKVIKTAHLRLLRDLLVGVSSSSQEPLFLWAYDFSVVPTSLVSTMYELFYNQEGPQAAANTHYTPPELVEFVLADLLTPVVLSKSPKVCDPACGSGIFLVEAYRRIVRFEAAAQRAPLSTDRLRELLLHRLAGCDIDEAAVRLAAFSLYVAFLNYQTPHDIRSAGPLPPLIARSESQDTAPLVVADAFSIANPNGTPGISPRWKDDGFDVVVGNPPWSEPSGAKSLAEHWAKERKYPVGDRSPSQLFLWLALDLLSEGGVASLLVSAKVLYNVRSTSQDFRHSWLGSVSLQRVINFSEVRKDYFEKAVAPFALIRFRNTNREQGPFIYETARRVPTGRKGSLALARLDRRVADQRFLRTRDSLWKTFSAGDHRDAALVARLELEDRLGDLLPDKPPQHFGYQRAQKGSKEAYPPDSSWRDLPSLTNFESWGPLQDAWFEKVPDYVKRAPDPELFRVRRLLVRRGIRGDTGPPARLIEEPLAFRHTTYAFPLHNHPKWVAQVALGVILSTLGRYWLYMVSGSWGTWNDDLRLENLLNLPIKLEHYHPATKSIVATVRKLSSASPDPSGLLDKDSPLRINEILADLDAAVADLFELTPAERDLVQDFWSSRQQDATKPLDVIGNQNDDVEGKLSTYLKVFINSWRPQLEDHVFLDAHIWTDSHAEVIAAVFETRSPKQQSPKATDDSASWTAVLDRFDTKLANDTRAGMLVTYGMLRAVTDSAIVVVKRNERRLFSPTAAREDAEATISQVMSLQGR